jgi:hypothetical protein
MADIKREMMRRMPQLQARMMEDILCTKAAEQKANEYGRVLCPKCGAEMENRGNREWSLQAQGGQTVTFKGG